MSDQKLPEEKKVEKVAFGGVQPVFFTIQIEADEKMMTFGKRFTGLQLQMRRDHVPPNSLMPTLKMMGEEMLRVVTAYEENVGDRDLTPAQSGDEKK